MLGQSKIIKSKKTGYISVEFSFIDGKVIKHCSKVNNQRRFQLMSANIGTNPIVFMLRIVGQGNPKWFNKKTVINHPT